MQKKCPDFSSDLMCILWIGIIIDTVLQFRTVQKVFNNNKKLKVTPDNKINQSVLQSHMIPFHGIIMG